MIETLADKLARLSNTAHLTSPFDDDDTDDDDEPIDYSDYTEEEIGCENKSVKILPGVRRLVDSLPKDRFAVATSGAKTYCHGALHRAGIQRPAVTITADDPRLKRGKPFPDPFLLAAKELGHPIEGCLIFEDSPSGIIAAVASGAVTIAVCTSHPGVFPSCAPFPPFAFIILTSLVRSRSRRTTVEKISHCGAHYIVPSLDCVFTSVNPDGSIQITIDAHPPHHPKHASIGSHLAFGSLPMPTPLATEITA